MYRPEEKCVMKGLETWTIIVPVRDNDEKPIQNRTIRSINNQISKEFGGMTSVNCSGIWKNGRKIYDEKNCQISVDVDPVHNSHTSSFFMNLKKKLKKSLKQDKIYVTKTLAKEEQLSFEEFFNEVERESLYSPNNDIANRKNAIKLCKNRKFILKHSINKTIGFYRIPERQTICWERQIFGFTIKTEFKDVYTDDVILCATDDIDRLDDAAVKNSKILVIGDYEQSFKILEKKSYRQLIEANISESSEVIEFDGKEMDSKGFIELFTDKLFSDYMILREEGFYPNEIGFEISDTNAIQIASKQGKESYSLQTPVNNISKDVQTEISRCLSELQNRYETKTLDQTALLQSKARNYYSKNRLIFRMEMQNEQFI
jgi:hypothetical protein